MTTIEVTQDDIEKGIRRDPWRCAIALAFQRKYGAVTVKVDDTWDNISECYRMREWVYEFDRRQPVEPTTFIFT